MAVFVDQIIRLRLCSHGTGPKWILPYPGKDHFCSHDIVPLATSGHTGPVCYGSVLNQRKKSSCFYQLRMCRIHVEAFKIAPKKAKSIEEGDKNSKAAGRTMNYPFS